MKGIAYTRDGFAQGFLPSANRPIAIACAEEPVVIKKILDHLKQKSEIQEAVKLPESRGPPQTGLFDQGKSV